MSRYSRRRDEDDFSKRNLEDFFAERVSELARDDVLFDYLDKAIRDDRRTESNLVNFVFDCMDMLVRARKEPRDLWEGALELASYFAAALIMEDRSITFESRRQEDEIANLADNALRLQKALERDQEEDDRYSRRDRDDRGRRGRNEFRSSRSRGRYEDDDYDDRRGRGRYEDRRRDDRRGGGYYEQRDEPRGRYERDTRRDTRRDAPVDPTRRPRNPMVEMMARRREEMANKNRNEDVKVPDPAKVNNPAYERVTPENIQKPMPRAPKQAGVSSSGNALPTGPITLAEIQAGLWKISDPEVVMAIPEDPKLKRENGVVPWEIDQVKATWSINFETGYRYLKFEPLSEEEKATMDRKLHELPVYGKEDAGGRYHPQGDILRTALSGKRHNVESQRKVREKEQAKYNDIIESIKAENAGLPEDQQKAFPEPPDAGSVPHEEILKSSEIVKGFGMGHIRMKEMSRIAELTNDQKGHTHSSFTSFQSAAESYEPILTCATEEEAQRTLALLKGTGLNFVSYVEKNLFLDLYESFKRIGDRIPTALYSAVRQHVTAMVNSIFVMEMGSTLEIDDFDDIATLYDDVVKVRGREFADKMGRALAYQMMNFQMFKVGSGITDGGVTEEVDSRTIYIVKRINMVCAPVLLSDLRLTFDGLYSKAGTKTFFVGKDSSPTLWKTLTAMQYNAHDDTVRRNFIWMADNKWVEVRKDFQDQHANNFVITLHDNL